jgi:hypothetical protein
MADMQSPAIVLGDPVPWFGAPLLGTGSFHLHVAAGRWIVLSFLGSPVDPLVKRDLDALLRDADLFDSDKLIFCGVLTLPPADPAPFLARGTPAIAFIADYDSTISRSYGADARPRTIVLDPMLRAIANVAWDDSGNHASAVRDFLRSLPSVDGSAGVPLTAPILIVPRVFDFPLCETLVQFYDKIGGQDSGFLVDVEAKTAQVVDYRMKRRNDLLVAHPVLREAIRDQIVRGCCRPSSASFNSRPRAWIAISLPATTARSAAISSATATTRISPRSIAASPSRSISTSISAGCDLIFPEFGRKTYYPPMGGAVVFSCGALHQVAQAPLRVPSLPLWRGRRGAARGEQCQAPRRRRAIQGRVRPSVRRAEPSARQGHRVIAGRHVAARRRPISRSPPTDNSPG